MGCFNSSGFISKLPIRCGDRVVCFIGLVKNKVTGREMYSPDGFLSPFFLPVRGEYDDYGCVENIDHTLAVDLLEKYSGMEIEELLNAVERCLYGDTVKDNIKYWENNEMECEKYKKLQAFFERTKDEYLNKDKDYTPVLMMEHERIYDQITKDFVSTGWWFEDETPEKRYNKFYDAVHKIGSVCRSIDGIFADPRVNKIVPKPFDNFSRGSCWMMESILETFEGVNEAMADLFHDACEELDDLYALMSSECLGSTMGFFDILTGEERLNVYDDLEEELRRFYNLWVSFSRAPMYFSFSQTNGMQDYDCDIMANVYEACLDRLRELKRNDQEESE